MRRYDFRAKCALLRCPEQVTSLGVQAPAVAAAVVLIVVAD